VINFLWTADELIAAMDGRPVGTMPAGVEGISIDTRSLKPGEAFFAIRGETMDGHDFATAAVKAGAALLVVAEGKLPALGRLTAPMIVVPDVLAALEKAGMAARARTNAKIVAVTGSVGKTTTKEALRHVLAASGKVHASDKSFNNHWGVPLTLARMPADTDFAVFEIGMNHPNEIRPLVKMVRPHIAIVTLIAAAHLGFFNSLDEIARAKAEIFEGLEPNGYALLNRDDSRWKLLTGLAREAGVTHVVGFGENGRAQIRLTKCELHADHSLISVKIGSEVFEVRVGAPGRHIVQNALAVLGTAKLVGADMGATIKALGNLVAENGRGRQHRLDTEDGAFTLIDESYNANPASMKAAIELLDATPVPPEGRRIAVLGDMLELGSHSAKLHAGLAELISETSTDVVLMAGPDMKNLADTLPGSIRKEYRQSVDDLKPILLEAVRPGDVVMVKSSKGIGFSKLVDALLHRFPAHAGGQKQT
jgi:UDP-N-acetylmuramoyl-tripeptide--D-alanyl-D-alanine ligase